MLSARVLLATAVACAAVSATALVEPRLDDASAWASTAMAPAGPVERLVVPAIDVDAKVVEVQRDDGADGSAWEVASYAVGHHDTSGVPGGGTNIVLSGHNNYRGEVFRRLDELAVGDEVRLRTGDGRWHDYVVSERRIVPVDGASRADIHDAAQLLGATSQEQVTLISCWPYEPSPGYRILVVARPSAVGGVTT